MAGPKESFIRRLHCKGHLSIKDNSFGIKLHLEVPMHTPNHFSHLSESDPFFTIINLSFERPPTGILSEPVMNESNFFLWDSENSLTICQKFLYAKGHWHAE